MTIFDGFPRPGPNVTYKHFTFYSSIHHLICVQSRSAEPKYVLFSPFLFRFTDQQEQHFQPGEERELKDKNENLIPIKFK